MSGHRRLKRDLIYKGHIINVYEDTMELPDGRTVKWDFIEHKGAAAIIPVDSDGKIIMVRQYRNAPDQYVLEIPAGGIDPGEDMATCAARELEEETGYRPNRVEHLIDIYTSVGFCNEKIGIYCGYDLVPTKQKLDEDEYISIEKYTLDELVSLIYDGTIMDSKTIAGILSYKNKIDHP